MAHLADTNVIVRWAWPSDALHRVCRTAVRRLRQRGEVVCVTPQVLTEYWAVATRPVAANGMGLTPAQAAARVRLALRNFPLLPDTEAVFILWQDLAERHNVVGRQVYDARIVAAMGAHGVTHVLTFNGGHFGRFPGVVVVDPASV